MADHHKKSHVEHSNAAHEVALDQHAKWKEMNDKQTDAFDQEHDAWDTERDSWERKAEEWEENPDNEGTPYPGVEPVEPTPPILPELVPPVQDIPVYESRVIETTEIIDTRTGPMRVTPGRILMTGSNGDILALSPQEFELRFQEVPVESPKEPPKGRPKGGS